MAYTKQTWVNNVTPVDAERMDHIEQGIFDAVGGVEWADTGTGALQTVAGLEIGYDQITSNVTISSATEAAGTTIIACPARVFDGRPVMVEFFSPGIVTAQAVNGAVFICVFEGGTEVGRIALVQNPASTANLDVPVTGRFRFTPTAGSHTYTVTGFQIGGNAIVLAGSGGTAGYAPTYVRFTTVGPAPAPPVELDYVQRTTDLTITATTAPTAEVLIQGNPITLDGTTRVKLECWARMVACGTGAYVIVTLWDGSTDLGRFVQVGNPSAGQPGMSMYAAVFATPSAGSHTYAVKAWKTGANPGIIYGNATDPGFPIWYRVTRA